MAAYPGSIPTFSGFTASHTLAADNHAAQHNLEQAEIVQIATKIGTGAATPAANRLLTGTGSGTSDWSKVSPTGTIVGTTDSQTLTNKTLTSPTINTPTINNPSLNTDTVAEFTTDAGVTIDGVLLKDGKMNGSQITNATVGTTQLTDDGVTANKIDWASTGANAGIWWEELGRATASGGANPTSLSVTSIPARKYLQVLVLQHSGGASLVSVMRFNSDSAANYQYRLSENGGADINFNSQTGLAFGSNTLQGMQTQSYITNQANKLKAIGGTQVYWEPGNTQLYRIDMAGKWENSTDLISRIDMVATTGSYKDGSELIVLGHN